MDIANLSQNLSSPKNTKIIFISTLAIIFTLAAVSGFWLSRFFPGQTDDKPSHLSVDQISSTEQLKVDQVYGKKNGNFKDKAVGTIESGGVNGEGTHTLIRPGGDDQKAALTSSVLDLDMFIGRKVEISGETNDSRLAGWFLDVGSIKILE